MTHHRCTGINCRRDAKCPDTVCPGHPAMYEHDAPPQPYQVAALVNWLYVCAILILIAIASVPELRAAIAGLF